MIFGRALTALYSIRTMRAPARKRRMGGNWEIREMKMPKWGLSVIAVVAIVWACTPDVAASEHVQWKEGMWRLELSGYQGIHQGSLGRSSDHNVVGAVEYEVPLFERFAFGLRAQPLFYYYDARQDTEIWGAAAGLTLRVYQKKEERRGFFGEAGCRRWGRWTSLIGTAAASILLRRRGWAISLNHMCCCR